MKTVIAVFCYKRAAKLKRAMEALLRNPESAAMDIVFFCDGYKGEADREGVLATRAYIDGLTGFRSIHKQYRKRNLSTGPNFQQGITWLCKNYDQFIVVEDDLVVSPNYIRFMMDALEHYREEEDVFSISGFCFPLKKDGHPYDSTIHTRFCCYGWASWSDRVEKVTWDKASLSSLLYETPGFRRLLNREGLDLSRILRKQISGKISTWDIQMQVHVARNAMKVVYPLQSKGCNIGFDNESTNTFGVDYLKTTVDDGNQKKFSFCPVEEVNPFLQQQLRKPYSFPSLAARKIRNTLIKLTSQVKKAAV